MVTPIAEWAEGEIFHLPQLNRDVRIRQPDIIDLAAQGDVPDLLTNLVVASINNQAMSLDIDSPEKLRELVLTLNIVAKAAFIEPRLADIAQVDVEAGIVPVSFIPFGDKIALLGKLMGAQYEAAESFPAQTNGSVQPVSSGHPVQRKTKRPVRNQR